MKQHPLDRRIQRLLYVFAGATLCLVMTPVIRGLSCGDSIDLDSSLTTTRGGVDWIINYNSDSPSDHYISTSDAEDIRDMLREMVDRQIDGMGFKGYYSSTLPDFNVAIYDFVVAGDVNASGVYDGGGDCFGLNVTQIDSPPDNTTKKVTAHELFHAIQKRYVDDSGSSGSIAGICGKVVSEGQTRCLDDRWDPAFDSNDGSSALFFDRASEKFLEDYTDFDFWKIGTDDDVDIDYEYSACIFWSYLCEQLGVQITGLENGYDWVQTFLERTEALLTADDDINGLIATDAAIQAYPWGVGEDFTSMYFDFAICNYARKFDQSRLDFDTRYRQSTLYPKYIYRDEQEIGDNGLLMNYNTVPVTTTTAAAGTTFPDQSLPPNSAKYWEWDLRGTLGFNECEIVGVRATSDDALNLCVLGITEAGVIIDLRKFSNTREEARCYLVSESAAVTDRIGRIVLIAATKDTAVNDLDIVFDRGPAAMQVAYPTATALEYPGPAAEPENVLVRVKVEGPGGLTPDAYGALSVQGLSPEDFGISINSLDAPVLSSGYVGGEYWLVVDAPVQVADGQYDLEVALCGGAYRETSLQSVLYGEYIFRHAVCMDLSGSMNNPVQKLEAAQQAAIFYVDTVRSDDRIGLVSFSGDGTEPGPVDDATAIGGKMYPGIPLMRLLMKVGISTFTAGGWTSIGDGLSISQDIIDADTTTGELIDTILLLSDGQQNEALLWDDGSSIRNRFAGSPGNDTIINTIAFGPEADLNLMTDIADATDGQASYIEVDVPDAATDDAADAGDAADADDAADAGDAADAAASSPSMFLRLAGAYLAGSEKAQRSERLVYLEDEIGPSDNQTYELDLQDHSVEEGTLYIYWDGDAGALDVTVLDPNGSEITVSEADILPPNYDNNERHKVWQMNVTLEHGIYEVQVENTTGDNVRFFAGISGKPENHAKCWLGFSSYLRAKLRPEDPIRQRFGIGQPVTLLAFLTDAGGVVKDADVRLQITLPTRVLACGPTQLFDDGAHGDGQAGDGVYGNVFRQTLWGQSNGNDTDNGGQLSLPEASGAYNVFMTVDGTANDGTPFHREQSSTFTVYEEIEAQGNDFDEDKDGLPSAWEISQGTNPKVADDKEDPDEDGLTNMGEYLQGTLAHNPDTDDGGESDGSEVTAGRCPLTPEDDTMRFSNQLAVLSKGGGDCECCNPTVQPVPNSNHIRFTRARSWEFLELQRAPTAKGPWVTIQTIDMSKIDQPMVEDPGLVSGTDYFYRMRGTRTSTGATTRWSNVARGTPWSIAEIFGPQGHLAINNGAATTDVPELMLHLGYNPDVTNMRLSHLSGFPGSPWQQANPTATYTVPGLGPGDPVQPITMYVQFRNAAGLVSENITDEITYDPSTVGNPDNDGDGINDDEEVFVFFTDPDNPDSDGDGITDGDEVAGGTNPLSNDSDNEGLTDGEELLAGTDPSVADTDGDSHSDMEEIEVLMTDPNDPEDALALVSFNQADASSADLTFASKAGVTYHFMVTDDLTNWVDVETSVVATGSSTTLAIPYPSSFDPTTTERIYVLVKVLDD